MTPGPHLDSLIARRLWRAIVFLEDGQYHLVEAKSSRKRVLLPPYSTDLDEAYRVVAKMQSHGWTARIGADDDGRCRAVFAKPGDRVYMWSYAATAPLAICEAALAAMENRNFE